MISPVVMPFSFAVCRRPPLVVCVLASVPLATLTRQTISARGALGQDVIGTSFAWPPQMLELGDGDQQQRRSQPEVPLLLRQGR